MYSCIVAEHKDSVNSAEKNVRCQVLGGAEMDKRNPIFRSLDMIEEKIHEKLTVEVLAAGIHFSKYHYQRMFREAVGDSVMGYVARRKIALAAEELAGTRSTILELALKYGFDSHEGFTRSFKAYMGVTPAEYRKYRLHLSDREKEKSTMMYSKTTDEMIRELNGLIAEAGETAAYTRKHGKDVPEVEFYALFWEFAAGRAEKMAGELKRTLERVTAIAQRPDEISARFLIVKAMEDAAFEAGITAFQTGLTIARALPEHGGKYAPLCQKYDALAERARGKGEKIAECLNELAALIFQDMRKNAEERMERAASAGRKAAGAMADPALPYGYLAEETAVLAEGFASMRPEEVTLPWLEDGLLRLETIAFAAEIDALRGPSDRTAIDEIKKFKERVSDALEFFGSLPGEEGMLAEAGSGLTLERTAEKMYSDLATQERILLFYLKGEIRKLEDARLPDERQKAAFAAVCDNIGRAVELAEEGARGLMDSESFHEEQTAGPIRIGELLLEAYDRMMAEAERLGPYGGPVRYLADAVKSPVKYLQE